MRRHIYLSRVRRRKDTTLSWNKNSRSQRPLAPLDGEDQRLSHSENEHMDTFTDKSNFQYGMGNINKIVIYNYLSGNALLYRCAPARISLLFCNWFHHCIKNRSKYLEVVSYLRVNGNTRRFPKYVSRFLDRVLFWRSKGWGKKSLAIDGTCTTATLLSEMGSLDKKKVNLLLYLN